MSRGSTPGERGESTGNATVFRFGRFRFLLPSRELWEGDEQIHLQEIPGELLMAFLEDPGELISRERLQRRLWGDRFVEVESGLNTAVAKLRRALGDSASNPEYLETVPRRGYRWIQPVEESGAARPGRSGSAPRRRAAALVFALLVVVVLVGAPAALRWTGPDPTEEPGRSLLAVLPIRSVTAPRLGASLTDELTTELASRFRSDVGVIARSSVERAVRDEEYPDVGRVAEELGADLLMEGSLDRYATTSELRLRLVDAGDLGHLWAREVTAPTGSIAATLPRLAVEVADALEVPVSPPAGGPRSEPIPEEAWASYLAGRWALREDGRAEEAVRQFERTVHLAPGLARGWLGLAQAVHRTGRGTEAVDRRREAAGTALRIDPSLGEAYLELAMIALYHDLDWLRARELFGKARELAPNLALVHHSMAGLWSSAGNHARAMEAVRRAEVLDPLSVVLQADACWYLYVARRWEEAVGRCEEALALDRDHEGAHHYLLLALLELERWEEAAGVARRLAAVLDLPDPARRGIEEARDRAAVQALRRAQLERLRAEDPSRPGRLAVAWLRIGELDRAEESLRRAFEEESGWIRAFLGVYPELDPLRGRPAFDRMVGEVRRAAEEVSSL